MRNMCRAIGIVFLLILSLPGQTLAGFDTSYSKDAFSKSPAPVYLSTERPWVWWFWMGNVVTENSIDSDLWSFHKSGFGGVTIISTYGVKGFENREIAFRSPRWYSMVGYTIKEARSLDMGVNLAFSSAWPYGGPGVTKEMAAKMIKRYESFNSQGGQFSKQIINEPEKEFVIAVSAISPTNDFIDLTSSVSSDGILKTDLPSGHWVVHVLIGANTGQYVKRSAPGGEGRVLDPFNAKAAKKYMNGFDSGMQSLKGLGSALNDSYEIYGADFTGDLLTEFKRRRGFSLVPYIQYLTDTIHSEIQRRVLCDYRETIADLLMDGFIKSWSKWTRGRNITTTEQAHGAPGNILDMYGAADIPQTESFGPSHFNIPGVTTDKDIVRDKYKWPDKLMFKFASSAANVNGRKLCSAETATWLTNHFKLALSQLKPQVDELFVGGINHIMLISAANSPKDVSFPGWVYYPAPDFGRFSSFYNYLPDFSTYVSRCQHLLQKTQPDNDILVYWPVYDYWSEAKSDLGILVTFNHVPTKWGDEFPFSNTIKTLWKSGYSFDYISDKQIAKLSVKDKNIVTSGGTKYKVILIPPCKRMPIETSKKLIELAQKGVKIIFEKQVPNDVPGWNRLDARLTMLAAQQRSLQTFKNVNISNDIISDLYKVGCAKEEFYSKGLEFIRKNNNAGGKLYYVANLDSIFKSGFVKLGTHFKSITIYDPLTGKSSRPIVEERGDGKYIYLEILPGQSLFLKTDSRNPEATKPFNYFNSTKSFPIQSSWNINFEKGAPFTPTPIKTSQLTSWTELPDTSAWYFSGTANYQTRFDMPSDLKDKDIIRIKMTDLREMATIYLNGHFVGKMWSIPDVLDIKRSYFKIKDNKLSVRVTNLSTNRIIWMDKQKIPWKTFYIADPVKRTFDASGWKLQPSGIIGQVLLTGINTIKKDH
jgi:hypothetical protein